MEMKRKPNYTFHGKNYFPICEELIQDLNNQKRYILKIGFKNKAIINNGYSWLIIMKNPSRAGLTDLMESDKTINTVCEYFNRRSIELNVKDLTIVNLFPKYLTDSSKLHECSSNDLVDLKNKALIQEQISQSDRIVFAWGTHPIKCKEKFEHMKKYVFGLADKKQCFQMLKYGKTVNVNRPLHGQVWGYENYKLVRFDFNKINIDQYN